jgi:catechol 2,3-dioxygenase-like lactoylglutathione lyase family enzyme
MRVPLGRISHFGLLVADPMKSAEWWQSRFEVERLFEFDDGVCVANSQFMLMLRRGVPSPETLGHMAFNVENLEALGSALVTLQGHGVNLEDPGDEIGPVGEGSASSGLWFHDLDGYRWELFVQG